MKIVHLCLSCFYIDGYAYQENELVRQHVADGHDVTVIASTENFGADRKLTYVEPSSYMGNDGAKVIRLPYRTFLPQKIMRKLRLHPGVFSLLREIDPDVVLFHGLCGWELFAAARYGRAKPGLTLYVDSHEDQNNSARNYVSRTILHGLYYRWIIQRTYRAFRKVLCVSIETMDFAQKTYGLPRECLEFFPLGGRVFDDVEYAGRRARGRDAAGAIPEQTVLLQTGKMGPRKMILESLAAFRRTPGDNLLFVLAGSLDETIREEAEGLMAGDRRIRFLGWKNVEELDDLLCAADVYVQPGTQSATMQRSLCARCPVILDDVPSHKPFVDGNGWLLQKDGDLETTFAEISARPDSLRVKAARSFAIASRLLDYRALAKRVLA